MGEDQLHIVMKNHLILKKFWLVESVDTISNYLLLVICIYILFVCLFVSFYQNLFQEKNDNNLTFID